MSIWLMIHIFYKVNIYRIDNIPRLYHVPSRLVFKKFSTMANTLKLFQLTQIYYKTLGICPTKPNQKYAFNVTSFFILLIMLVDFVSTATFFFFKAETTQEYSDSFYISSSVFNFTVCFVINVWKMSNILELIGKYEEFVQKSKLLNWYKTRCGTYAITDFRRIAKSLFTD